jgi:hypothetical protein
MVTSRDNKLLGEKAKQYVGKTHNQQVQLYSHKGITLAQAVGDKILERILQLVPNRSKKAM